MIKKHRKVRGTKGAKGGEFCVVHPDGTVTDAELHEEILAGDHPIADEIGKDQARKIGISEAMIRRLYADD